MILILFFLLLKSTKTKSTNHISDTTNSSTSRSTNGKTYSTVADANGNYNINITDGLPDGTYVRATLAHGDHQSYGDYAGTTSIPGTNPDHLEGERSRRITEVLLGAWGAREVLGKSNLDGLLDGSVEIDPDLTVEAQSR